MIKAIRSFEARHQQMITYAVYAVWFLMFICSAVMLITIKGEL